MKTTTDRLMDLAESHMRRAGYNGFSFRILASEVGVSSTAVHHHFGTKAEMAAAVARRYADRFLRSVERRGDGWADDVVAAYRDAFRALLERDLSMCLCGALDAEAGALSPEVTCEMRSFFRRCIDDLSTRIGGPEARERAFHVMATLEGGMVLAHAHGSVEAYDRAVSGLSPTASDRPRGDRDAGAPPIFATGRGPDEGFNVQRTGLGVAAAPAPP